MPKPSDWDDREEIPDANDTKPAEWDEEHRFVPDPNATQPEWWNSTEDGEWTRPVVFNTNYGGRWTPRNISNPAYMGPWKAPLERNPAVSDAEWQSYCPVFRYVAIDVWQAESGTIFDNIIITDDAAEFDAFVAATWRRQKNAEKPGFFEDHAEREANRVQKEKEKKEKKAEEERERLLRTQTLKEIPSDDEADEWYMEDI